MDKIEAQHMLDRIMGQVCGYQNTLSLDQFQQKYAFDIRLPQQVSDSIDGKLGWASSTNPTKFITYDKSININWEKPFRPLNTIEQVIEAWQQINYTTLERSKDSLNTAESDNIRQSENVFRSQDVERSKNVLFSDGINDSEYVVASQRSGGITFCVRVEDSGECSESFSVAWSAKIVKSMFISDCYDLYECMFCSHISSKKYYIANMPFSQEEYFKIKTLVVKWILGL